MHTRHEIIRKINEFFGTANSIIYTTSWNDILMKYWFVRMERNDSVYPELFPRGILILDR